LSKTSVELLSTAMLPIAWKIKDKAALVIGGGEVASGRVRSLVNAEADVTVIAPTVSDEIKDFVNDHKVEWINREFDTKDLDKDYCMVMSAIDDRVKSHEIYIACKAKKIPVNVADIPADCDFYFGAVVEKGPLQVMISTGGEAPRLAHRIRKGIERKLDEMNVEKAIEQVGKLRAALRDKTTGTDGDGVEYGYDKDTIKQRMKWISHVCDNMTFDQMAQLSDEDINRMVDNYPTENGNASIG
jgi:precorrin-2 dehydrogenase/sirohydrochlorin ferrochelatase